jgi:hypothetical protein
MTPRHVLIDCFWLQRLLPSGEHAGYAWPLPVDGKNFHLGGEDGNVSSPKMRNDLWSFDLGAKEWTLVSGDAVTDTKGAWGTKGVR